MINLIYEKLFAYGDKLAEEKNEPARKVVHECQRLVHEAFVESEKMAKVIVDRKPKDAIEEFVLSIPDIKVLYDTLDSQYYYELDDWHFDSPREVLKYVIECRTRYKADCAVAAKREMLNFVAKVLRKVTLSDVPVPRSAIPGRFVSKTRNYNELKGAADVSTT